MTQQTDESPIDVVYPINPHGPAVFILNEYSSLYRIAISPPSSLHISRSSDDTAKPPG